MRSGPPELRALPRLYFPRNYGIPRVSHSSHQGASCALFSHLYRILSNSHRPYLPEAPGIYFLLAMGHLYIGQSRDLRRRVPESQHQWSNWGAVYFLPMGSKGHSLSHDERKILMSQLEASCIGAAHTMIFGHQLPIRFGNRQHAKTLPFSALDARHLVWPPSQRHDVSLGINVARAIFKDAGMAARYCKLPSRKILASVQGMDFSKQWEARRHVLANPFRPDFNSPVQGYSKVKTFNEPLIAANATPLWSTSQAA